MMHFAGPVGRHFNLDPASAQIRTSGKFAVCLTVIEQTFHMDPFLCQFSQLIRDLLIGEGECHDADAFPCGGEFLEQKVSDSIRGRERCPERKFPDRFASAECFLVGTLTEFSAEIFVELFLIARGNTRRFENDCIIIVFPRSVHREIIGPGPNVFRIRDHEFIMHQSCPSIRYNLNSGVAEFFHSIHHGVIFIGNDSDCNFAVFCRDQRIRNFIEIQIEDTEVDRAFCACDEIAESLLDIGRRRKIKFDRCSAGNLDDCRVIIAGDIRSYFCNSGIAQCQKRGMDRFQ